MEIKPLMFLKLNCNTLLVTTMLKNLKIERKFITEKMQNLMQNMVKILPKIEIKEQYRNMKQQFEGKCKL